MRLPTLPRRLAPLLPALLGLALLSRPAIVPAFGHDGPEHDIEELTARLAAEGPDPDLLIDRAIEFGVLGRYPEAMRDLEHALQLNAASLHAQRELSRFQYLAGRTNEALATVTQALKRPIEDPVNRGGLLILRAEWLRARNQLHDALADCNAALRLHRHNPEWYLLRSDLQRRLGLTRKRLSGVEDGLKHTGAGVLGIERVEALLDDGQYREALRAIEPELASSRIQCRWRIRRGRALLGLGRTAEAEVELREALAECDTLLAAARPDTSLFLDQARAYLALGDRDAAQHCLTHAREKGGDPALTARIEDALKAATAPPSEAKPRAHPRP